MVSILPTSPFTRPPGPGRDSPRPGTASSPVDEQPTVGGTMTTPERSLEQLAADYARHRAAAVDSAQRVAAVSATVTSPQGLVTVTVGGQGEVRTLSFNSQDFRKMAPAELAHVVLETIDRA